MRIRPLFGILALAIQSGGPLCANAASVRGAPAVALHRYLDAVPGTDVYPWIVGKGWPGDSPVHLTARFMGKSTRAMLRTSGQGSFSIGVEGVRWCTGLTIEAVDATGHRVVLHGANPFQVCPSVSPAERLGIRQLTPREMAAHQYLIYGGRSHLTHPIRVGDMLYVYVHLSYLSLAGLDRRHFSLIEQGVIPKCPPNADCAFPTGIYYRVVAIRAGQSAVPVGSGGKVEAVTVVPES